MEEFLDGLIDLTPAMCLVWLFYIGVAIGLSLPVIWFGRKRAGWCVRDIRMLIILLIIPFWVWALLFIGNSDNKGLDNLWEGVFLGIFPPLGVIARVVFAGRVKSDAVAIGALLLTILAGVMLWGAVPAFGLRM